MQFGNSLETEKSIVLADGPVFEGNDRFRFLTLSPISAPCDFFGANVIRGVLANGAPFSVTLDTATARDPHPFDEAPPVDSWFELVKMPGSTWFLQSPSIHVHVRSTGGQQPGLQCFFAASSNPNHDSLSSRVGALDAPDPLQAGH